MSHNTSSLLLLVELGVFVVFGLVCCLFAGQNFVSETQLPVVVRCGGWGKAVTMPRGTHEFVTVIVNTLSVSFQNGIDKAGAFGAVVGLQPLTLGLVADHFTVGTLVAVGIGVLL